MHWCDKMRVRSGAGRGERERRERERERERGFVCVLDRGRNSGTQWFQIVKKQMMVIQEAEDGGKLTSCIETPGLLTA